MRSKVRGFAGRFENVLDTCVSGATHGEFGPEGVVSLTVDQRTI